MATKLEIVWKGDVAGLNQHRLSISEFAPALTALLKATRRIASGIITNASDTSDYGRGGGKYASQAESIDIQISGLFDSSVGLTALLVMTAALQKPLIAEWDIEHRIVVELIECLESEGAGIPKNAKVRQYLEALPRGISEQSYKALDEKGSVIHQTTLKAVSLATPPKDFPNLLEISGLVIGVGFPPGSTTIKFRYSLTEKEGGEDGESQERIITCAANKEQVEKALRLREHPVLADVIQIGSSNRLLHLRAAEEFLLRPKPFSEEVIGEHFERWDAVMKGLA